MPQVNFHAPVVMPANAGIYAHETKVDSRLRGKDTGAMKIALGIILEQIAAISLDPAKRRET